MTVSQMRARIAEVYTGKGWKRKVDNMPEYQVIAVYHSFLRSGKFEKKNQTTTAKRPATDVRKPVEQIKIPI